MIRKLIPQGIKRFIRIKQRKAADSKNGFNKLFALTVVKDLPTNLETGEEIRQPIFYNPLSSNKVENIRIAIEKIQKIEIKPGQIFSFWEIVGYPTKEKGFKTGRNIIGDSLQEDIGGGLCQVSGMIYHLALIGGLEIIERFNHTLDLYEEDKRYTPLGADATVVFGYKDIRFKNNTEQSLFLDFDVNQEEFKGRIKAEKKLPLYAIRFDREEFDKYRTIKTYRSLDENTEEYLNLSKYIL